MRHLTKKWYLAMQNTLLHKSLIPAEPASVFSEEYFMQLYRKSEQEYLDSQRSLSEIDPKALALKIASYPPITYYDGSPVPDHELETASAFQKALTNALSKTPALFFDPEKEKNTYLARFNELLNDLQYRYPPEILAKVADPRVLALDHAAPNIVAEIRTYCEKNQAYVDTALDAKRAEHQRNWQNQTPAFFEKFSFHDASILSVQWDSVDFILNLEDDETCRFKNATILKMDTSLENAIWLYNEIYPISNGYEIHILLLAAPERPLSVDSYSDLILQCSDVEITTPW